jgi:hypothetical protein
MIGLKAILLALIALLNASLLSCQGSNTNSTDISRSLTQKIPPSQSKRNLYPMLKTDLSDMILSDWHYTKEGSLLIKSNEDIERNSFILCFNPSTGKIMDKCEKIYNFGSYEGENSKYWCWSASRTRTLLLFSKSNLAERTLGPSGVNSLSIAEDYYITLNGTKDIETMSCYSLTDDTSWTISLVELSKAKQGIVTVFLPLIFEKNDQILLFSYDAEIFIPSSSHNAIEWGLDCWIFNRKDGKLLQTDFFAHFTDDSKGNIPLSWRADDLFRQEEDALFFYRHHQGKLVLDRYQWDGKLTLNKLWSFELPQHLWIDQTKARSFFHPKLFSDSLHYWLILQQTSSLVSDKTFERSYLLGIDKASGQMKSELCLNEEKTVEEWQMLEDHFLISFDKGLASANKADQKIQWQYHWKRDKDQYTQVLFADSFVYLLTYRQPNHHQIVLRTIDKTGKLIPIASFEDKPELLERMESNEPGFYVPPYDLFVIPREDQTLLVLSNRGEVFQYEH